MRSFSSFRIVRFVLVPLISLWIAGAGCMLGCAGMVATAAPSGNGHNTGSVMHSQHSLTIVAAGDACASKGSSAVSSGEPNKSHDCCKKSSAEAEPDAERLGAKAGTLVQSGPPTSGMLGDCPLAGRKTAVFTKSRGYEASSLQAVASPFLPVRNFPEQPNSLSTPPRLTNRGHTYLSCCVFLI